MVVEDAGAEMDVLAVTVTITGDAVGELDDSVTVIEDVEG